MHNLHLVRIKAESAKQACENVLSEISHFGNENNWFTICGCVSETNEVLDLNDGRYSPKNFTIEDINKMVKNWLVPNENEKFAFERDQKTIIDWYMAKNYCKFMYELSHLKNPNEFDVLRDFFYETQYDYPGITEIYSSESPLNKTYIFFVDMHS